jgi:hypothetical protein
MPKGEISQNELRKIERQPDGQEPTPQLTEVDGSR